MRSVDFTCAWRSTHASMPVWMNALRANADVLTSAYMAAGMTSRARRRQPGSAG